MTTASISIVSHRSKERIKVNMMEKSIGKDGRPSVPSLIKAALIRC